MLRVPQISCAILLAISSVSPADDGKPIDVGSRRELFVDRHLIGKLTGDAVQKLQIGRASCRERV